VFTSHPAQRAAVGTAGTILKDPASYLEGGTMKRLLLLFPLLLVLAACAAQPSSTPDLDEIVNATLTALAPGLPQETATLPPATAAAIPTLTPDSLQNGLYTSPDWGVFQLTNGIYYRTPPTSQESPEAYTTRLLDTILYGDLDLDGDQDAVVFLATQSGGTGHFVEMAAVLNRDGSAGNAATLSLGDRVVVESGSIADGVIALQMRVQGPNDPMCCPSQAVTWTFRLENGQLMKIP
jgi:hypothetical protein